MIPTDLGYAKPLRVGDFLDENFCAVLLRFEILNRLADVVLDNVVAKDHADRLSSRKILRQAECVGNPSFSFLIGVV